MSYVENQQKKIMLEKLRDKPSLTIIEIASIIEMCQNASSNATGIGKIKGMIQHIDEGNAILVSSKESVQKIEKIKQLADYIKSIDEYLDIQKDRDFKDIL